MKLPNAKHLNIPVYLPFLFSAICLAIFRLPWIDESWFAGTAVTLLDDGAVLDFGMCRYPGQLAHAFSFELYALVQAIWYWLFGIDLIGIRFLNLLLGLASLAIFDSCLKQAAVTDKIRKIAIGLSSISYYFLYAATQNRPEMAALFASALGVRFYLTWRSRHGHGEYLLLANLALIAAALFHLQAVFVGLAIWVNAFVLDRKLIGSRELLAFFAPYAITLVAAIAYLYPLDHEFALFITKVFITGDMLGHSGGMIGAVANDLNHHQWYKSAICLGLVVAPVLGLIVFKGMHAGANQNPVRSSLTVFAAGAYASWLLTTAQLNDYHAVWLVLPLTIALIGSLEGMQSKGIVRLYGLPALLLSLALAIYSSVFVGNNIFNRPYSSVYYFDLQSFSEKYKLTNSTVGGVRDIQWYFGFSRKILCVSSENTVPEFYVLNNEIMLTPELESIYRLLEKGRGFSIYRKI